MKEQLLKRLPYWLFVGGVLKGLYFSFEWPLVAFLALTGGMVCLLETHASNAIVVEFNSKIKTMDDKVNLLEKELVDVKGYVSASKMSNIRFK